MKKRWWHVWTGSSGDERSGDSVLLGTFYGHIDVIALALADKQSGFWCDGKLTFEPTTAPKPPALPQRTKCQSVNVVVKGEDWFGTAAVKKAQRYFKGRPVAISDCSQYAAVTIQRR